MPIIRAARRWLPTGMSLTDEEWRSRHRVIVVIAALHAPVLMVIGLVNGIAPGHVVGEAVPILVTAAVAAWSRVSRRLRTLSATISLVTSSAVLVHVTGGYIEAHFHFFVVVAVVMLYHDWLVFLVAFGYVVLHHGLVGTFAPQAVFNHGAAFERPMLWALIHGSFIAAASAAGVVSWHFNQQERERTREAAAELESAIDRLAETNRRLEHAVEARDDFLSRVSHELRTPLTAIRGFAETLHERPAAATPANGLNTIRANAHRLERLIDDLLSVGQLDSGRFATRPEEVDLGEVVAEAVDELGGMVEVVMRDPGCRLQADPDHARQILTNLLLNAHRYGVPPVEVSAEPVGDGSVQVRVRDHGPGVPEEFVGALFQRFSQASVGDRRTAHGVGLGLWIVRSLAELNGGHVSYESAPGGGACFVVELVGAYAPAMR